MTQAEYKRQYDDLLSQISNLHKKVIDLKTAYKTFAPFQVGDKVLVTLKNDQVVECFISGINLPAYKQDFEYTFAKAKKDGTMSGQSAGIFYTKSINHAP